MIEPSVTQSILGVALALHLAHHRLARRHISFVEVAAATLLVVPVIMLPPVLLVVAHLGVVGVLLVGSIGIRRLSPSWERP